MRTLKYGFGFIFFMGYALPDGYYGVKAPVGTPIGSPFPNLRGFYVNADLTPTPIAPLPQIAPDAKGGANNPITEDEAIRLYGSTYGVNVTGVPTTPYDPTHDSRGSAQDVQDVAAAQRANPNNPKVKAYLEARPDVAAQVDVINQRPTEVSISNPRAFFIEQGGKYETTTTEGKRITLMANDQEQLTVEGATTQGSVARLQQLGLVVQPADASASYKEELAKFNASLGQYGFSRANPATGAGEAVILDFARPAFYRGLEGETFESRFLGLTPVASTEKGGGYLYLTPSVSYPSTRTVTATAQAEDVFPSFNAFNAYAMSIADKIAEVSNQVMGAPYAKGTVAGALNEVGAQLVVGAVAVPLSAIPFAYDLFGVPQGSRQEQLYKQYLSEGYGLGGSYAKSLVDTKGTQAAMAAAGIAITTLVPEVKLGRFTLPVLPAFLAVGAVGQTLQAPPERQLATLSYNVGGIAGILALNEFLTRKSTESVTVEAKARPVQTATQEDVLLLGVTKRQGYIEASAEATNFYGQKTTVQTRGISFDVLTAGDRSAVNTRGLFGEGADVAATSRGLLTDVTGEAPVTTFKIQGVSVNLPKGATDYGITLTKGTAYQLGENPLGALTYRPPVAATPKSVYAGSFGALSYEVAIPQLNFRPPVVVEGIGATRTAFFSQEVGITEQGTRLNIQTRGSYIAPAKAINLDGLLGLKTPAEPLGFNPPRAPVSGAAPVLLKVPTEGSITFGAEGIPSVPKVTLPKTLIEVPTRGGEVQLAAQRQVATMAATLARDVAVVAGTESARTAAATSRFILTPLALPSIESFITQPQTRVITETRTVQKGGIIELLQTQTRSLEGTRPLTRTLTRTLEEPRIAYPPEVITAARTITEPRFIVEPRAITTTVTLARIINPPTVVTLNAAPTPIPIPVPQPPEPFGGGGGWPPLPIIDLGFFKDAFKGNKGRVVYAPSFKAVEEGITAIFKKKPSEKKLTQLSAEGIGVRPVLIIKSGKKPAVPKFNALNSGGLEKAFEGFNYHLPASLKRALKFR